MPRADRIRTLERTLFNNVTGDEDLSHLHRQLELDDDLRNRDLVAQRIADLVALAESADKLHRLETLAFSMRPDKIVDPEFPTIDIGRFAERKPWTDIRGLGGLITDASLRTVWEREFHTMQRRVCRISVDGVPGTGFLVAANVVLTSYHLVDVLIERNRLGNDITVWFDYQPGTDTTEPSGEIHRLDPDWWISHSKTSPADDLPENARVAPNPAHLDYVLLRLADAPGMTRGIIPVPARGSNPHLRPGMPLAILQYATLRPLEIAMSPSGFVRFNDNQTRFRHRVNTRDGASGAPIFDINWNLVGIHRGWVKPPDGELVSLNDAIPISRIRDHFLNNPGINPQVRAEVGW